MKDILSDANRMIQDFNSQDLPYKLELVQDEYTNINGGIYVVAKWKWMDATYFSGISITNEIKDFAVYVKLEPNGDYVWFDSKQEYDISVSPNGINGSTNGFYGKTWSYHKEIVLGKDNKINKNGIVTFTLNTKSIHEPIKEWLNKNGYKKRKMTLNEHINNFIKSQDKLINNIVATIILGIGCIFTIIGLVFLIDLITGNTSNITDGTGNPLSPGDITIFVSIFLVIGLIFLIFGIIFLKKLLSIYKKN